MAHRLATALLALALTAAGSAQTVHYVDVDARGAGLGTSWGDAYTDLQDALDVAASEDEIWIAEGTYLPDRGTGDRDATFTVAGGRELYGGFSGTEVQLGARDPENHPTILSGDLAGDDGVGGGRDDNAHHVVTIDDAFAIGGRFGGLIIEGGEATGARYPDGGGLLILGGGPTMREMIFRDNRGDGGGAVWISGNSAPTINDSLLIANHALSGAGGAVLCTDYGGGNFANTRFMGNTASEGGGAVAIVGGSTMAFNNTVFAGNVAGAEGGALSVDSDDMVLQACTVTANTSGVDDGGGVAVLVGLSLIQASIVWGNEDAAGNTEESDQVVASPGAEVYIEYTVLGGYTGVAFPGFGNFAADPVFTDPLGPDGVTGTADDVHRLSRESPCIDKGPPLGSGTAFDLLDFPRRLDSDLDGLMASDMGANEFCHARLELPRVVHAGEAFEMGLDGTPGLFAHLIVSTDTAAGILIPYGAFSFDFVGIIARLDLGITPLRFDLEVPETVAVPDFLVLQALVIDPATGFGNLTNGRLLWIEP